MNVKKNQNSISIVEEMIEKVFGNKDTLTMYIVSNTIKLLIYDLKNLLTTLSNAEPYETKVNLLRTSSVIFKNIDDFLLSKDTGNILKNFPEISKDIRQLRKKLKLFLNIRNYSAGHIAHDKLVKIAQWDCYAFFNTDLPLDTHVFGLNKTILEYIINSYISLNKCDGFSTKEVDILYNENEIIDYWVSTATMATQLLTIVHERIKTILPIYTQVELFILSAYSAETEFNLK